MATSVAYVNIPLDAWFASSPGSYFIGWPVWCGDLSTQGPVETIKVKELRVADATTNVIVGLVLVGCATVVTERRLRIRALQFTLRTVFAATGFVGTVAALENIDMPGTPPDVVLQRVGYNVSLFVIYAVIAVSWLSALDVLAIRVSRRPTTNAR